MTELRKALEEMQSRRQRVIDFYHRNGPQWTSEQGNEYESTSDIVAIAEEDVAFIEAALASQSPPPTDDVRAELERELRERRRGRSSNPEYNERRIAEIEADLAALSAQLPPPTWTREELARAIYEEVEAQRPDEAEALPMNYGVIADRVLARPLPPPIRGEERDRLEKLESYCFGLEGAAGRPRPPEISVLFKPLATPSSPEGWVLVPREPWQAMLNAADEYLERHGGAAPHGFRWHELWSAMIAASPSSTENKS